MSCSYNRVKAPVSLPIPGGSKPGKAIILRGQVTSNSGFEINVMEKSNREDEGGDILFQFHPCIKDGVVVRTTCIEDYWGKNETDQPYFPFEKGKQFLLKIAVAVDEFRIYINGKHFIDFGHRLDPNRGLFLHLGAGAKYFEVLFKDSFEVPYQAQIPENMQVGKTVRVRGTSRGGDGFFINFACDRSNEVVAFQIYARPEDEAVLFNSLLDGCWGAIEGEYQGDYPFFSDLFFDVIVICRENKFQVYVNDEYFASFDHRCEVEDISYLCIDEEVDLADVQILDPIYEDDLQEIPNGLIQEDVLVFKGVICNDAQEFGIALHYGLSADSDIALNIRFIIGDGEITFNSRSDGEWGKEEKTDLPQSIADAERFEVEVIVKEDVFKVYIDGEKRKKFKMRGNLEGIEGMHVTGDVLMFLGKLERFQEKPVFEETGVLQPGSWIIITGVVEKHPDEFCINLLCGNDEESDIAFHFNPRFDEGCTVRDSKIDGNWQEEERDQNNFPFQKKESFEIVIKVTEDKFMTYVDGDRYIDFNYRIPLDQICYLQMEGSAEFYETEIL